MASHSPPQCPVRGSAPAAQDSVFCESPEEETDNREVSFTHVVVPGNSPLIGQTSSSLSIRNKNNCLIVGIERADGIFHQPDGQTCFEAHDVIWLVGEPDNIKQLIQDKIENHKQHT